MNGKRILLIVGGGIAAYKSLDLVRRLKERGASVRAILTKGGAEFITPLSLSVLTGEKTFTELFDLKDEAEIGHIRLSREADLVVVAPATADLLAKMAQGLATDLASTVVLATDKTVLAAPAMNVRMWQHPATRRNLATLRQDGIRFVGPDEGEMACGEYGPGRMAEPQAIVAAIEKILGEGAEPRAGATPIRSLAGMRVLITSGPTHEPIDPVRYIANRSSGKQGHALARAAVSLGADVTLVTGPVSLPDPDGVRVVRVETAEEMLAAALASLPADIAICAAAVADWRAAGATTQKLKKEGGATSLRLTENPDILATLAKPGPKRPRLVIGFAAETENLIANASEKRRRQGRRLDRRQRRFAGHRRDGRRRHANPSRHRRGRRGLAASEQGRDGDAPPCPRGGDARRQAPGGGMSVTVRVKRLPHGEGLPLPSYQSKEAAGLDVVAGVPEGAAVAIPPGARALIPTGFALELPRGYEAQVRPRSGLALKHGVTLLNSPGTIDSDYRGELMVILVNHGDEPFLVRRGERIAQLVIAPVSHAEIVAAEELAATSRGPGGFGSTG